MVPSIFFMAWLQTLRQVCDSEALPCDIGSLKPAPKICSLLWHFEAFPHCNLVNHNLQACGWSHKFLLTVSLIWPPWLDLIRNFICNVSNHPSSYQLLRAECYRVGAAVCDCETEVEGSHLNKQQHEQNVCFLVDLDRSISDDRSLYICTVC